LLPLKYFPGLHIREIAPIYFYGFICFPFKKQFFSVTSSSFTSSHSKMLQWLFY